MPSSAATCVNGRPLPASSDTVSRLNSSVNIRLVLLVIRAPRSLRSLSEVSTQPGQGQRAQSAARAQPAPAGRGALSDDHRLVRVKSTLAAS
jgi:hypothetical protein